ncbi:MAG: hypothetical protein EZS28_000970 [Streblomastix strix]|uniref:Uncharacterized protein n=1 Tax=Streblomastix strix TaxID=222440 RepID=A0A5J4XAG2_9EUKA|nr:MAG: hypothetical protein EZS28_000970 [Streblomastix strix]
MGYQAVNTEAFHIQRLRRVLGEGICNRQWEKKEKEEIIRSSHGCKSQKRNIVEVIAAVVAVLVTASVSKYNMIGQGKETWQLHEQMETRTDQKMMNATDKQRKRDRLNSIENTRLRTNNNPNHNNRKCKRIHKQMKTRHKGVLSQKIPFHSYNLTIILKQTYISTSIIYVYNAVHLTNFFHLTFNYTHHHPHWKKHQPYQEKFLPKTHEDTRKKNPIETNRNYIKIAGLMDVVERLHEIMKLIIEEEKKKPKIILPGQYKQQLNKDGPAFHPSKNYRQAPKPRPQDLNLSEEQWEQFDGDVRQGVVPFCLRLTDNLEIMANLPRGSYIPELLNISDGVAGFVNIHHQIYQSIPESVIGLIMVVAQQIFYSETEIKDQEQLTIELGRIVADGTEDNVDDYQSEHAIEPQHFIN